MSIPDKVSVVGWDDSSLARLPHLNLTTIRQDADVMTRLAVERSVARIHDDPGDRPGAGPAPETGHPRLHRRP